MENMSSSPGQAEGRPVMAGLGQPWPTMVGGPRKVDNPKKKKVEKPQDGRQKSNPNIGNPYQMEDNKVAPSAPPQGGGASRRPLGVLVVFHTSYVLA